MLNLIAIMMPCLSLQVAVTVSETEARSYHHKWEKHSQELLQLSRRIQTQHFLSSQEATEYDFNSILCVFLQPTQKQMQSAELLLRKTHLGNHDRLCAQISLQHDISLVGFCTQWHFVASFPTMRLRPMARVTGNNVITWQSAHYSLLQLLRFSMLIHLTARGHPN